MTDSGHPAKTQLAPIDFDAPPSDPIALFTTWQDEAARLSELPNPNAMTVATIDAEGRPNARVVLLKSHDADGAVFFTNRTSRKGRSLAANPHAALVFHWDILDRQLRVEGEVTETSAAESDAYYASRPRGSRIAAWASEQSAPIPDRVALEQRERAFDAKFPGDDVPRPPHWGGYRVRFDRIEFWQGHPYRLHDRIVYTRRDDGTYDVQRLSP